MSRTKISTLTRQPLYLRQPTEAEQKEINPQGSATFLLVDGSNKAVAMIEIDDLFDENGNRFEDDT